jgi:hypothetical protein
VLSNQGRKSRNIIFLLRQHATWARLPGKKLQRLQESQEIGVQIPIHLFGLGVLPGLLEEMELAECVPLCQRTSELLTYPPKSWEFEHFSGHGCGPKTVRFFRPATI